MERYRTSGVVDENALNEVQKYLISGKAKWVMRILAAVYVLFGLSAIIAARDVYAVMCLVLGVLLGILPRLVSRRLVKTNVARLKEAYPGGVRAMESYFDQDGLVVINRSGGENVHILYPAFNRVAETEHYFFLASKAGQFCLVYKNFLTSEERASFIPFLKEKCPKIKVMR